MSSILNFIKNLPQMAEQEDDLVNDSNYVRKSANLINDALHKGADIMQMPNGDVHITETKVVTYKYTWNPEKARFERATANGRVKSKKRKAHNQNTTEQKVLEKIA